MGLLGLVLLGLDAGSTLIKSAGRGLHLFDVLLQVLVLSLHLGKIFKTLIVATLGFFHDVAAELLLSEVVGEFSPLLESQRI